MTYLTLLAGNAWLPVAAMVGTATYGMTRFSEQNVISGISHLENGRLEITI